MASRHLYRDGEYDRVAQALDLILSGGPYRSVEKLAVESQLRTILPEGSMAPFFILRDTTLSTQSTEGRSPTVLERPSYLYYLAGRLSA